MNVHINHSQLSAALGRWLVQQLAIANVECNLEHLQIESLAARNHATPGSRHFRITTDRVTHIVIDMSQVVSGQNSQGHTAALIKATALMADAGLRVPAVLAADVAQGFLLLADPGRQTYLDVLLADPGAIFTETLLRPTAETLIRWQLSAKPDVLPVISGAVLRQQLQLFSDCYLGQHLGISLNEGQKKTLDSVFASIIAVNLAEQKTFVHGDFVLENWLVSEPESGYENALKASTGAVFAPISYDLASLYKDAFLSFDEECVLDGMIRYWEKAKKAGLPMPIDFADFYRDAEWMGLQRHLYLLGAFARPKKLASEDGENAEILRHLADAPRFLRYIRKVGERYTALFPLIRLVDALKIDDGVTRKAGIMF